MGFADMPIKKESSFNYTYTNDTPLTTTAGRIRKAALHCSEWDKGLKLLFPEAFELSEKKKQPWQDDWF